VAAAAELARERQERQAREDELRAKIAELRGAAAALQVHPPAAPCAQQTMSLPVGFRRRGLVLHPLTCSSTNWTRCVPPPY
jgi:hypothetical protein